MTTSTRPTFSSTNKYSLSNSQRTFTNPLQSLTTTTTTNNNNNNDNNNNNINNTNDLSSRVRYKTNKFKEKRNS